MKKTLEVKEKGKLSDLKKGQIARVLNLENDDKALRRRLLDMGITHFDTVFNFLRYK